ncbi:hypothetical protein MUP01_11905 [Candidatus Bathyarchaeota archaeon]|nr:hypothetical protein [Candidatus Bathyarchaeota archaeon]
MKKITMRVLRLSEYDCYPSIPVIADNEQVLTARILGTQQQRLDFRWEARVMLVIQTTEKEAQP